MTELGSKENFYLLGFWGRVYYRADNCEHSAQNLFKEKQLDAKWLFLVPKKGYNRNSEQQGLSCDHLKFWGSQPSILK